MNSQEKKEAVLRFLFINKEQEHENVITGVKFSVLKNSLKNLFIDLGNDANFESELKEILNQCENEILIKSNKHDYYLNDALVNDIFYNILPGGEKKCELITNPIILETILDDDVKDLILLNLLLDELNPFSEYRILLGLEPFIKTLGWRAIPKSQMFKIYDDKSCIRIYYFLKRNGFIKVVNEEGSYKFNKRGRKLLEIANYEKYMVWESNEKIKSERRQQLSDALLENNNNQILINFWIAIGTTIAGFCALDLLVRNQYNAQYHIFHDYVLPYGGLVMLIWLLLRFLLKYRYKRNNFK